MVAAVLFISLIVALIINMPVGIAIGVSSLCAILADGRISSLYIVQQLVTSADSFPLSKFIQCLTWRSHSHHLITFLRQLLEQSLAECV